MDADFLDFLRQYQAEQSAADANLSSLTITRNNSTSSAGGIMSPNSPVGTNLSGVELSEESARWFPSSALDHFDFLPEELPYGALSVFTVLYVVIIMLGLGGNVTTALVVTLNREMRTVTNVFLVSLAASDALIAGVNMPVQLRFYSQNEWTLGSQACKLTAYVQGVVIVASILTLTSLAIDRYDLYALSRTQAAHQWG